MNATTGFYLAAAGLFAIPAPDPVVRRLSWLAKSRIRSDAGSSPGNGVARARHLASYAGNRWVVALIAVSLGSLLAGAVPGALAGATGWVIARYCAVLAAQRDAESGRAELAIAVAALADEYAGGATTNAAFMSAASVSERYEPVFSAAAAATAAGIDASPLFVAESELVRLGLACQVVQRSGAVFTSVLAGVQADLAADRAIRRSVNAALTGPRTSAMMLALLPAVGLVMGTAMGADPERILLHSSVGLVVLTVGVALDLTGLLWTLALTDRACP